MGLLINPKDARLVSRLEVNLAQAPAATPTWCPIPHIELLNLVEDLVPGSGLEITDAAYGLSHEDHRFFAVLQVRGVGSGFSRVIGLRNSTDKRLPAGLCAGIRVTVCSNLVFSGTIQINRKHTANIRQDLPGLVMGALSQVEQEWRSLENRVHAYKQKRVSERMAHHLLIRGLDEGVYSSSRIPVVLEEWRNPSHGEFRPRTLWSFHNACTEHLKDRLHILPARTAALNRICDRVVGLN